MPSSSDNPAWLELRHPRVRDLAWCVFSSSILQAPQADIEASQLTPSSEELSYLQQLDNDPTPLINWLEQCPSPRLGFIFEHYWKFWWQQLPADIETRYNLQIHHNGRTQGELDALFYSKTQSLLIHRELAVKFYLALPSKRLEEDFRPTQNIALIGPNVRDRLDLKVFQLINKQLAQLHQTETLKHLPADWHWDQLQRQLVIRGRLFTPIPNENKALNLDEYEYLSREADLGHWLTLSNIELLPGTCWLPLRRDQWFAPIHLEHSSSLNNSLLTLGALHQQLIHHFHQSGQPLQVAAMSATPDGWREIQRCFVVPDQWPATG